MRTGQFLAIACLILGCLIAGLAQAQGAVTLTWSASGDDSLAGTAASYDLRYSTSRPDTTTAAARAAWWSAAQSASGLPTPTASGSAQSVTLVIPSSSGRTFYFVLRVADESGNLSGFSNVATKSFPDTTPPAQIRDLRAGP